MTAGSCLRDGVSAGHSCDGEVPGTKRSGVILETANSGELVFPNSEEGRGTWDDGHHTSQSSAWMKAEGGSPIEPKVAQPKYYQMDVCAYDPSSDGIFAVISPHRENDVKCKLRVYGERIR